LYLYKPGTRISELRLCECGYGCGISEKDAQKCEVMGCGKLLQRICYWSRCKDCKEKIETNKTSNPVSALPEALISKVKVIPPKLLDTHQDNEFANISTIATNDRNGKDLSPIQKRSRRGSCLMKHKCECGTNCNHVDDDTRKFDTCTKLLVRKCRNIQCLDCFTSKKIKKNNKL
jgi:hypothetical protein